VDRKSERSIGNRRFEHYRPNGPKGHTQNISTAMYGFFSNVHGTFFKMDHV
jgi:hypothetical protein